MFLLDEVMRATDDGRHVASASVTVEYFSISSAGHVMPEPVGIVRDHRGETLRAGRTLANAETRKNSA